MCTKLQRGFVWVRKPCEPVAKRKVEREGRKCGRREGWKGGRWKVGGNQKTLIKQRREKPRLMVYATRVASMREYLNSLILSIFLSLNNKNQGVFVSLKKAGSSQLLFKHFNIYCLKCLRVLRTHVTPTFPDFKMCVYGE